jgi:hypothetical protein
MKFWPSSEEAARTLAHSMDCLNISAMRFSNGDEYAAYVFSNGSSREQIGYVCFVPTGAMTLISATTSSSLT